MAPDTPSKNKIAVSHGNSIGMKIMVANMVAMILIGVGVVTFSEYRRSLVYTELSLLEDEAQIWSYALSHAKANNQSIADIANELSHISPRQAFVFDANGKRIFSNDSQSRDIATNIVSPNDENSFSVWVAKFLLYVFPVKYHLPVYTQGMGDHIQDYAGAERLNNNLPALNAWVSDDERLVFTASVPVDNINGQTGTVMLVKSTTQTDLAFQNARLDMARILLSALVITVLLTLYVGYTITRPLNQLANAASKMMLTRSRREGIPDLGHRGDEIGALSTALRAATDELWTRLESMDKFTADVTHELKNPLTSIRSAIETLPRIDDRDKRATLMRIMADDVQRLDRLITDISKSSRLDVELARAPMQPVAIANVLHNVTRAYIPEMGAWTGDLPRHCVSNVRGVRFDFLIPAVLPSVMGDAARLEQVFDNIIGNALSFAPDGSLIVIMALVTDTHVRICVDDQGPGIPPDKLNDIFNRFYTERPQSEVFGTHSGLGLSIARQIVDALGGRIWAENRMDICENRLGARFSVELRRLHTDDPQ